MRKKFYLSIGIFILVSLSCNKNQKTVRKIDETWTFVQATPLGSLPQSILFEKCKVSKNNCNGTYTAEDGSTFSFVYRIDESGTLLTIGDDVFGEVGTTNAFIDMSMLAGKWTITERKKSSMILESSTCAGCYGKSNTISLSK